MAFDAFLKLPGIEGESNDSKFTKQIEVQSYSFGEERDADGSAARVNEFHIVTAVSKASPKVALAVFQGTQLPDAVLSVRQVGGEQQTYLRWTLTNANVTSYRHAGATADVRPLEEWTLAFRKLQMEYFAQKDDGSLEPPVSIIIDLDNPGP